MCGDVDAVQHTRDGRSVTQNTFGSDGQSVTTNGAPSARFPTPGVAGLAGGTTHPPRVAAVSGPTGRRKSSDPPRPLWSAVDAEIKTR